MYRPDTYRIRNLSGQNLLYHAGHSVQAAEQSHGWYHLRNVSDSKTATRYRECFWQRYSQYGLAISLAYPSGEGGGPYTCSNCFYPDLAAATGGGGAESIEWFIKGTGFLVVGWFCSSPTRSPPLPSVAWPAIHRETDKELEKEEGGEEKA